MKKLFLSVLPLLALGMTACGGGSSSSSASSSSQTSSASSVVSSSAASEDSSSAASEDSSSAASEDSSSTASGVTYTITTTQNWVFGTEGVPVFAHYWDGINAAAWAEVVYTVGGMTGTFVIPSDYNATGFLIVRCAAGTTEPSWSTTGDDPGRIYNKTKSDTDIVSGTVEYTIPEMEEYTPSAS